MSNGRPFTCYFCNKIIENETEVGHTTVCSKVLEPCPYKCGAYVTRIDMAKHKRECFNNTRKSANLEHNGSPVQTSMTNTKSLDRNAIVASNKLRIQNDIERLHKKFADLETRLSSPPHNYNGTSSPPPNSTLNKTLEEIRSTLQRQSQAIQKANYFNGFISEWRKNIENQVSNLKLSLSSMEVSNKESGKHWSNIQEKLLYLQNLQMDLNLLKETVYKDNTHFKKNEMDFARNIEELRSMLNEQNIRYDNMWSEHDRTLHNIITDIQATRQLIDEQKAKYAGLIFDLRAVSQISSEAAERIEIQEREFKQMRQDVNQMRVDFEILEGLASSSDAESRCYERLLWRITDVESKIKRAKENDIVLKSPIFYTHKYGYKIRVLLYPNGLKKWKDRYALACLHILKGEYDPLLTWPCTVEGNIILRDVVDITQPRNFSKYIKIKRTAGDEEEDEPQESSSTYIFIPHSTLLKNIYLKNDTVYLDINICSTSCSLKSETSV